MTADDPDITLPSIAAVLRGNDREQQLLLTLVFHPDPSRIGESAELPPLREGDPTWILGRRSPVFGRSAAAAGGAIGEQHVSRQALAISACGDGLALERFPGSSRCRLAGRELQQRVELGVEQLRLGVPIMLGHSVVLLLRLAARRRQGESFAHIGPELCGGSQYMQGLRHQIARAAQSDLDVLIRGETGTGKELVAAAIHRASLRAAKPMVSINMTAIPPGLAAATLFGSARGAYTGSHKASDGYFTRAEGGTLFLDEIGDTPAEVQPLLLRALQQREIQLVGGPVRRADVRVISATDADIDQQDSGFRAALRHRLGGCEIRLAPLREHPEDIGELILHFLQLHRARGGDTPGLPGSDSSGALVAAWAELFHRFLGYHWPGNVRELGNYVAQVLLVSSGKPVIPDAVLRALRDKAAAGSTEQGREAGGSGRSMRDVAEGEFEQALSESAHEVASTARRLGVSRQAVYRHIEASPRHRLAEQVPLGELQQALAANGGDIARTAAALRVSASALRARLRVARSVSES